MPLSPRSENVLELPQLLAEPRVLAEEDLAVPSQFAITSGGHADVYRGHLRIATGASVEVAVKLFRTKDPQDGERLQKRLKHEAKIFIAAKHPLIVEIYGTVVVDTGLSRRPALVLRWHRNGDASRYLAGRTTREKLIVVKDMAMALEHLHSQNIIHGDLKGANVLITDTGNAVLTDFGLSHCIDKQTKATSSSTACSVRWLSPELAAIYVSADDVFLTVRNRTKQSDVWSYGSTAFELLSGRLPYAGTEFFIALTIKAGTSPLDVSPNTVFEPSDVTPILQQCWWVQPAGRPTMSDVVGLLSLL